MIFAGGHTATNTPDLFRTPKLTVAGPGQYCRGGPGGKTFGCCRLFFGIGRGVSGSLLRLTDSLSGWETALSEVPISTESGGAAFFRNRPGSVRVESGN